MAICHNRIQHISRGVGRSAIAAAAYRAAAVIHDRRTGQIFDYDRKSGVLHSEIFTPTGVDAPAWLRDRAELWNRLEEARTRKNARLATEFTVALPAELDAEQRLVLAQEYAQRLADRFGVAVDLNLHAPDPQGDHRNFHAHVMMTSLRVTGQGFGGRYGFAYSETERKALGMLPGYMEMRDLRAEWAHLANYHLARAGHDTRIDPRSFRERGLDIEPTAHMGPHVTAIKRAARDNLVTALTPEAEAHNARIIRHEPGQLLQILTASEAVFTRQDIAVAVHRYVGSNPGFASALEAVMNCAELVQLQGDLRRNADGQQIEVANGLQLDSEGADVTGTSRAVSDRDPLVDPARYSTRAMIDLEASMAAQARQLAGFTQTVPSAAPAPAGSGASPQDPLAPFRPAAEEAMRQARGGSFALTPEQSTALRHVTQSGRLAAVVGVAGAGKSTMLEAARRTWEAAGFEVHGAALAATAAEGLHLSSGIRSRTIESLVFGWRAREEWDARSPGEQAQIRMRWAAMSPAERLKARDRPPPRNLVNLTARSVLVIDEAGMVDSRTMAALVQEVHDRGAKLVLIGDPEQLPAIGAGASFRAIVERTGYGEIGTVYRQNDHWQRDATMALARGEIARALDAYAQNGRIAFTDTLPQARERLVADYLQAAAERPGARLLALAYRNADINALNAAIRDGRRGAGQLGPDAPFKTERGPRAFAPGDRVLFLKNDQLLRAAADNTASEFATVRNNYRGTVLQAAEGRLVVALDGPDGAPGPAIVVEQARYAHIDHGYAVTIHKAQGATVDRSFVLPAGLDRNLAYVALSRHRESVSLYAGRDGTADLDALKAQMGRYRFKQSTLDYARAFLSPGRAAHEAWISGENRRRNALYAAERAALADTEAWDKTRTRLRSLGAAELAAAVAELKPAPLKPSDLENHPDVVAINATLASLSRQLADHTRAYADAIQRTRSSDSAAAAAARGEVALLHGAKTTAELDLLRAERRRDAVKAATQRRLDERQALALSRHAHALKLLERTLSDEVRREALHAAARRLDFDTMTPADIARAAIAARPTDGMAAAERARAQLSYERAVVALDRALVREQRRLAAVAATRLNEFRGKSISDIAVELAGRIPAMPTPDSVAADPIVKAAALRASETRRPAADAPDPATEAAWKTAREEHLRAMDEAHARQYTAARLKEAQWRAAVATLDRAIAREHRGAIAATARADLARQGLADPPGSLTEGQRAAAYRVLDDFKAALAAWQQATGDSRTELRERLRRQADRIVADPAARRVALDEKLYRRAEYHSTARRSAEARAVAAMRNEALGLPPGRDALAPLPVSPFNYVAGRKGIIPPQSLDEKQALRQAQDQVARFADTLGRYRATFPVQDRAPSEAQVAERRGLQASLVRQADALGASLLAQAVARDRGLDTELARFTSAARDLQKHRLESRRNELLGVDGARSAEPPPSPERLAAARTRLERFEAAIAAWRQARTEARTASASLRTREADASLPSVRAADPVRDTRDTLRSDLRHQADAILSDPVALRLARDTRAADLALRYSSTGIDAHSREVARRRDELMKQTNIAREQQTRGQPQTVPATAHVPTATRDAAQPGRQAMQEFNRTMDRMLAAKTSHTTAARAAAEFAAIRAVLYLPDEAPAGVNPGYLEHYNRYRQYARGFELARASLTATRRAAIDKDPVAAFEQPGTQRVVAALDAERAAALGSAIRQDKARPLVERGYFAARASSFATAQRLDRQSNPQLSQPTTQERDQQLER